MSLDVAACFSEEEWKLLHEWQKDLYRNVMKEIHQALISLGPLIATTVFSLKAKEKKDLCPVGSPDSERRYNVTPSPGFPSLNTNSFLRKEEESAAHLMAHLEADLGESSAGHASGRVISAPVVSFKIKEEDDTYTVHHQNSVGAESISRTTGEPVSVFSQSLKSNEETHLQKEPQPEGRAPGEGSGNRKREAGCSVACTEQSTACKALCGQSTVNVFKSTEKGTHSISQLWSEINQEMQRETSTLCKSRVINAEDSKLCQETSNIEIADQYNDCQRDLWKANRITCQPNTQNQSRPYACAECEKRFKTKYNHTIHLRTHSGERPFHCTVCNKSFSLKQNLIRHKITHTGERPYQCTECGKSFSLKESLNNHRRTHLTSYKRTQLGSSMPLVNPTWKD